MKKLCCLFTARNNNLLAGNPNASLTQTRRQRAVQRGSLLILVVVALVLMVILGTTYLRVARIDRIASSNITTNYIDQVKQAVIGQISKTLREDLVNGNGDFFVATDGDEPYDYHWTNTASPEADWPVILSDGSPGVALGNFNDDTWLASSYMDFSTATPAWPHVTNLTGIRLELPSSSALDNTEQFPGDGTGWGEYVLTVPGPRDFLSPQTSEIDTSNNDRLFLNATNASSAGADTDGDGIEDAFWTWAPIRQIAGVTYVMAVRIIDNSSLLNANVALSQVNSAGAFDVVTDAPRWFYPSELDMGGFVDGLSSASSLSTHMGELGGLLNYRGAQVSGASPRISFISGANFGRADFWLNGPALYNNFQSPAVTLGIADELELRYNNGLDNPDVQATIENATNGMPAFLRHNVVAETSYTNVVTSTYGISIGNTMRDFMELEPRHQLTAVSGAAIYAPRLPIQNGDAIDTVTHNGVTLNLYDNNLPLKLDINVASASQLTNLIRRVIEQGPVAPNQFELPWVTGPASPAAKEHFANQLAANILDYKDSDSTLTVVGTVGSNEAYGLEALPFVTEIYAQRSYEVDTTPANTFDNLNGTWTVAYLQLGETGYVIEIRNPFDVSIDITNITLRINGNDFNLNTIAVNDGVLDPKEVIVLYHRSNNTAATGNDDTSTLIGATEAGFTQNPMQWDPSPVLFEGNAAITVELLARTTDSVVTDIVYQTAQCTGMDDTNLVQSAYTTVLTTPAAIQGAIGTIYKQRVNFGNGNRFQAITLTQADFLTATSLNFIAGTIDDTLVYNSTTLEQLGVSNKAAPALPGYIMQTLSPVPDSQIIFPNSTLTSTIDLLGELSFITILGPINAANQTIADRWNARTTAENFMLDFSTTTMMDSTEPNYNITHASFLLDRLTTLSPLVDGQDNDGDTFIDAADTDEFFVPGTINLNTASELLLNKILPVPDGTVLGNVTTRITSLIASGRTAGGNAYQGIAYLGELYADNAATTGLTSLIGAEVTPADNPTLNGTVIDFLPNPATPDGIVDDREEKMLIPSWLAQVGSTRSDIFTAYVLIRGYPSRDFRGGQVESTRFMVIFDRSGIVNGTTDQVKILAVRNLDR